MNRFLFLIGFFLIAEIAISQNIAITDDDTYTANSSAMLDVKSLTKGLLIPRMTTAQRTAISSPAAGLLVYDTSLAGFYFYNGSAWVNLSSGSASGLLWSYSSSNSSVYLTTSADDVGIGTSAPLHKLHVVENVTVTNGTDGSFIDIQNSNTTTGIMSGIRFFNGTNTSRIKGGIFYKTTGTYSRGDLIFANNPTASSTNVTASDARLTIKNNGTVEVNANPSANVDSALFQVKNSSGFPVFAVYPEGVRVYVYDDTLLKASGSKGGFAVGGFTPSKSSISNEYLRVTPDSVRIYIEEGSINKASGSKGGFAVGGFSPSKSVPTDYFNIYGSSSPAVLNPSQARIFWYPLKEAFLAGRVIVEHPDSVGLNSFSTGNLSRAKGNYSQAFGNLARAYGLNSTAIGNNAKAEGQESYAFGNYAKTANTGSYAFGSGAKASGLRSFAVGSTGVDSAGVATDATKALGDYSYAFGMGSISSGKGAFTFGTQNTASGDYSLALGYKNTSSFTYSVCLGSYNTSTGLLGYGISIGLQNNTSGFIGTGVGIGFKNQVYGSLTSAAIGFDNNVNGLNSFAIGAAGDVQANNAFLINLDGQIPSYYTSLTQDNTFSIMHGDVGIGTTTPSYLLHATEVSTSSNTPAIYGEHAVTEGYGIGVQGVGKYMGVKGTTSSTTGSSYGIYGAVSGTGTGTHYGVYGTASGGSTSWGGYFAGNTYAGLLSVGTTTQSTSKLYVYANQAFATYGASANIVNAYAGSGIAMAVENSSYSSSDNVVLITQKGSTGDILSLDSWHGSSTGWDREFKFSNNGVGYCDGSWNATGADYAEYFPKNSVTKNLESGDIVVISDKQYEAEPCNEKYSKRILGVVSSKPAIVGNSDMDSDNKNNVLVGLMGVVETKVSMENGEIHVGDFITSSSEIGVGMKATGAGMVVGRALQSYNGTGNGKIKVMVNPIWFGGYNK